MSVRINIQPLDRFVDTVINGRSPMGDVYRQWTVRYRAFAQNRFVKQSQGGGDWPDLAPSTKRRRRGPRRGYKGARRFAILQDTRTIFNALDPDTKQAGSLEQVLRDGVRVGYGGSAKHPKAPMTIARLTEIHHRGLGHNPKREIIVEPDQQTVRRMCDDLTRGLNRIVPK
jgi:hypothetical protein